MPSSTQRPSLASSASVPRSERVSIRAMEPNATAAALTLVTAVVSLVTAIVVLLVAIVFSRKV